jgi:prophage regulatory protein
MSARETERRKRQRQASLQQEHQRRILRLRDVMLRTGLPRSSIYRAITQGRFPSPVPLGLRTVGWVQAEVDDWIAQRVAERDAQHLA